VVAACILYGILAAISRDLPEPADPWLDGWTAAGIKAEFRSVSTTPGKHLLLADARELCDAAALEGTTLRSYLLQNGSAQIVRLPKAEFLPEIPEGRTLEFRMKKKKGAMHVSRVGRTLFIMAIHGKWIPFVGLGKTPRREVERAFDAFEKTVERYP
jgi:hypothetical protein